MNDQKQHELNQHTQHQQPILSHQEQNKIINQSLINKQNQTPLKNNSSLLSISQTLSVQKQQKQSSNDGLNTDRSFPSSNCTQEIKYNKSLEVRPNSKTVSANSSLGKKSNSKARKSSQYTHQNRNLNMNNSIALSMQINNQEQKSDDQSEDLQINYGNSSKIKFKRNKFTLLKLFLTIFKKQYAIQLGRVLLYAFISISIFSYVLDQNKQKKEFYQAFYSSQQITISKQINGVFPPLFGTQSDIINRTWILQTYNKNLLTKNHPSYQQEQQLLFQFKPQKILYIRPNTQNCVQQLKFKWKIFDYNMRLYQILQTQFERIEDDSEEKQSCFNNKKQISQLMNQVSIWTINWESKQLYLLSEPFREGVREQQNKSTINKNERWNELIVLTKQLSPS